MPNWTSNTVTITGPKAEVLKLKKAIHTKDKDGERNFDFEKIIPMPQELWLVSGSISNWAIEAAKSVLKDGTPCKATRENYHPGKYEMPSGEVVNIATPEDLVALGNRYLDNEKKYGYTDWYTWANARWGTKWNPSSSEVEETINADGTAELVYTFDTAWCEPTPVFEALSAKYPKVKINNKASYEDPEPWTLICTDFEKGVAVSEWTETDEDLRAEYCDDEDEEE